METEPTPSAVSAEARSWPDIIQSAIDSVRESDRAEIERLTKEFVECDQKSADAVKLASQWKDNCDTIRNSEARIIADLKETIARLESELTLHNHRCEAAHNEGQRGMPQGDCECSICRPFYQKLARLESEVAEAKTKLSWANGVFRAERERAVNAEEKLVAVTKERDEINDIISNKFGGWQERTEREVEIESALNDTPAQDRDSSDNAIGELLALLDYVRCHSTKKAMGLEQQLASQTARAERLESELKNVNEICEQAKRDRDYYRQKV